MSRTTPTLTKLTKLTCVALGVLAFLATSAIAPFTLGSSVEVSDLTWEARRAEFAKGGKPVLYQFYAPWCGYCRKFSPTWRDISAVIMAEDSDASFTMAHVDAVESVDLAAAFRVTSFPTLKMVIGDQMYTFEGARKDEEILAWANGGYLSGKPKAIGGETLDVLYDALEEAQMLFDKYTLGAGFILGVGVGGGLLAGLVVSRLLFGCAGSRGSKKAKLNKKKKN